MDCSGEFELLGRALITGRRAAAHRFTLQATGRLHLPLLTAEGAPLIRNGESVCPIFLATFLVIADTPDGALEFAARIEPEPVRASMSISSCRKGPNAPDESKGVLAVQGGYLFVIDEEP